jgi:RNA recognition motif-containing protein
MLFLGGMPTTVPFPVLEEQIRKLLSPQCTVEMVSLRIKGNNAYAFISITEAELVDSVIRAFDGATIEGRKIVVQRKGGAKC